MLSSFRSAIFPSLGQHVFWISFHNATTLLQQLNCINLIKSTYFTFHLRGVALLQTPSDQFWAVFTLFLSGMWPYLQWKHWVQWERWSFVSDWCYNVFDWKAFTVLTPVTQWLPWKQEWDHLQTQRRNTSQLQCSIFVKGNLLVLLQMGCESLFRLVFIYCTLYISGPFY